MNPAHIGAATRAERGRAPWHSPPFARSVPAAQRPVFRCSGARRSGVPVLRCSGVPANQRPGVPALSGLPGAGGRGPDAPPSGRGPGAKGYFCFYSRCPALLPAGMKEMGNFFRLVPNNCLDRLNTAGWTARCRQAYRILRTGRARGRRRRHRALARRWSRPQ